MKKPLNIKVLSVESILLAVIAIAVFIRIINLGSREFWYDEVLSLLLSTGQKVNYKSPEDLPVILANYTALLKLPIENGLKDSFQTLEQLLKGLVAEPHPPLFFLEQHFWLRWFGNSEIAMRSLVVLFSIGAMGCAYGIGRRLLSYRGGLLFAALLGINPYFLFHSLNVRMYSSLVFWTLLSTWSLLKLMPLQARENENPKRKIGWIVILMSAITAGFLTFYYFACWIVVLAILVLLLDRRRWWQYAIYFIVSIAITTPWLLWGTRQQLRNADLDRFTASEGAIAALFQHLQEFIQVLGIQLFIGDWVSILPPLAATIAGIIATLILVGCSISLWRSQQRQLLAIGLTLGIFPLILMLLLDIFTGKFTLGFGWGRSVIFVLPGCLFLVVIWLERSAKKWQTPAIFVVLILYLSISVADLTLRPRWMFHQLAEMVNQQPQTPTLIVMNSPAWGHVLRLAYYLPPSSPLSLLVQKSDTLAPTLTPTLVEKSEKYQRILWLDSARPVWGKPSTEEQKKQVQQVLENRFDLQDTQSLTGTWELDNFTVKVYRRRTD